MVNNKLVFVEEMTARLPVVANHICEQKRNQGFVCRTRENIDGTIDVQIYNNNNAKY